VTEEFADQPVANVHWISRDLLHANGYNPNRVAGPEMALLALSIIEDGWTQPIVIVDEVDEDGLHEIVDGFHRWTVSGDPAVYALTGGMVPVVILRPDLDPSHQRMSTVRHNRARGVHYVVSMAEIVEELVAAGISEDEVARRLGMEDEEVRRLREHGTMPTRGSGPEFSRAWAPQPRAEHR